MTPEKIEDLERKVGVLGGATISRELMNDLLVVIALAKHAIPSGRMAEDYEHLHKVLRRPDTGSGDREECPPDCIACGWHLRLKRLVTQAQSAEAWRKRMEAAADALADALPGEVGRLDLVARIAELKRQRDARERDLMIHFEAKNEALNNLAQEREWRQKAEALANENADKANAAMLRASELERCREALADALSRQGLDLAAAEERLRVLRDADSRAKKHEKAASEANAALKMYADAWRRELGSFYTPKRHEIDAFVVSTRSVVAKAREAEGGCARLSEHVDKTAGASLGDYELDRNALGGSIALLPNKERADTAAPDDPAIGHEDCPDRPCPGHHPYCEGVGKVRAPNSWTMRDEFAKAAMQTFLGDRWRNATEATMLEYAQRAYRMADAMVRAREDK